MRFLTVIFSIGLLIGCGGGSSSPSSSTTSTSKSNYGIFRQLKSVNAPKASIMAESVSSATSSTMSIPRAFFKSIQMLNGKVLIVGGDLINGMIPDESPMNGVFETPPVPGTMDIFDPTTETFTKSNAQLTHVRASGYISNKGYEILL